MSHTLPALAYAYDALEPHIDALTMEIHHRRHHQTYITNLNAALVELPELAALPVDELLARRRAGDEVELHLFRRDELMSFRAVLAAPPAERQELKLAPRADSEALRLRRGWLGG